MSLHSSTVWEMQTGGSNLNGGGFYDRDPGTSVDYSQQTSAQLSLTDLACLDTAVTLISAMGGFTAAMVGNLVYIASGTNFVAGWYEITAYTDTNTVTIDRTAATGGTDASAGVGKVGGCAALPTGDLFTAFVAGNKLWMKYGTYTLTASIIGMSSGSSTAPIVMEGYKTTRGDKPTGADLPTIAAGAYEFNFGGNSYQHWKYLDVTGAPASLWASGTRVYHRSCRSRNTSGSANRVAIRHNSAYSTLINCDIRSDNGYGCHLNKHSSALNCYAHDSAQGFHVYERGELISGCIAGNCTIGFYLRSYETKMVLNCTVYHCTTGISINGPGVTFINNIIEHDTGDTGIVASSDFKSNYYDYNNYHGNGTDVSNVTKGPNATAHDPDFEDAAGGDFRLKSGSSCLTAGQPITLGVGSSVTTHQGAVPPVAGGGGGLLVHPGTAGGMRG